MNIPLNPEAKDQLLESVRNALRIIKSFSTEEPEHRVTELAIRLGLSKSAVSRIMSTLASEGLILKGNSRGYRLGPTVVSLASAFVAANEICQEAKPILRNLADDVKEMAQLAVLEGTTVIFLDSVEYKHPLRLFSHVGSRSPVHCSSSGKVLVAFHSESLVDEIIRDGLVAFTHQTITDAKIFIGELAKVREQGYAVSLEEKFEGVMAVAAPIRNKFGEVVAAVNVVGPSYRMKPTNLEGYIRHLLRAAKEISSNLIS
ncbi:IclR family transcriptional regulator [Alicyclobacillus fastidiosus]|uniref:IclR family transcriptional regulator n=1 Tax=Alicyclobacillus fastidiosus TaxID=392011 RepID=A0ABY6ZJ39_9BACL|nr:IclR family transcriptional regulator [Alicyclobacillus fastidiosus]WAH42938.1 IclR family transcriptional regulator [Alicyclobacillus fastidiosus]GMA64895.1 IclR family transcriptional regulator [Alicyclobacillus fastidiosus]